MMDALSNSSSSSSCGSAPPLRRPKSPPGGGAFDLYGKRRQLVKVQILEREIGLLQEELKSIDEVQPASKCCKELDEFVGAKSDPLVAINQETRKSNLSWKKLCFPWICCSSCCGQHCKMPNCWGCCQLCNSNSGLEKMGSKSCCRGSCPRIGKCCLDWSIFNCREVKLCCCGCSKTCYDSCGL